MSYHTLQFPQLEVNCITVKDVITNTIVTQEATASFKFLRNSNTTNGHRESEYENPITLLSIFYTMSYVT